mmetsp:Transcript_29096/g.27887  ORF Transcript_29096/g.27887 Transcript_29096/m.27887 type:complete len:359 (+) Transcript_29096:41-1117(+)
MLSTLFRDQVPLKNVLKTISKSQIKIVYNNSHLNYTSKTYAKEDKPLGWKKAKLRIQTERSLGEAKKITLLKQPMNDLMLAVDKNFIQNKVTQEASDILFAESIPLYDIPILSNVMKMSTQSAKGQPDFLLKSHLPLIASRLSVLSEGYDILKPWSFKHLSFMVYGLRDVTEGDEGVKEILSIVNRIATINMTGTSHVAMQDISMMLLGLKENNGEGEETKKLLSLVALMTGKCLGAFKARGMGNALFGLKEMSSDSVEVRSVLAVLAEKIEKSNSQRKMQYHEVQYALRGMAKMSTDCDEVKAVLRALVPIIEKNKEILDHKEEILVLEALEVLNSECDEVKAIKFAFKSKYPKKKQ